MSGTVVVLNCGIHPIKSLLVNGVLVDGAIPGWTAGPVPARYTPRQLVVPRSAAAQPEHAAFVEGTNTVEIQWYGLTGRTRVTVHRHIDPKDDLVLFLTASEALLLDAGGRVVGGFGIFITPSEVTACA
jgi:hypothetical protein